MPAQNAPLARLEHRIPRSIEQLMYGADTQYGQTQGLGQISQQWSGLEQERQGLMSERQGINQINQMDPALQQLAQNAAYAPLQGMQPALQDALLQAGNAAAGRGLGRSTISAALQAQAVPRIMQPVLAQAQGQYSQALLDLPFQERQLRMQSLGQGMDINQLGMRNAIGQQGLRESAFDMLQRAQSSAQAQLEFQKSQKGGMARGLLGLAGGIAGQFLGPIGGAVGAKIGDAIGGGGGAQSLPGGGYSTPGTDPGSWMGGSGNPYAPSGASLGQGMQVSQQSPWGSWGGGSPYMRRAQ